MDRILKSFYETTNAYQEEWMQPLGQLLQGFGHFWNFHFCVLASLYESVLYTLFSLRGTVFLFVLFLF